jgi:DNA anti-recombination protein RmuC
VDPISGGAGWVGAGLLGLVLGWLMFIHLPAKDKQLQAVIDNKDKVLNDLIQAKDSRIKEVMEVKDQRIQQLSTDFRAALDKVVDHCQEEAEKLAQRFSGELASVRMEVQKPLNDLTTRMLARDKEDHR